MKRQNLFALAVLAGTTVAMAAPRESFDLVALNGGPLQSVAKVGGAGNSVVTVAVTGSDGGGSYSAQSLTFAMTSGTQSGASWGCESRILVTPPTGSAFVVQASTSGTGGGVPSGSNFTTVAMPVDAVTTAGNWRFESYDSYDDSGTDMVWAAATVTFNDSPAAVAALSGVAQSTSFTNVDSNGLLAAGGTTQTWIAPAGTMVANVKINGFVTARVNTPATNDSAMNTGQVRVRVTSPTGQVVAGLAPIAAAATSGTVANSLTVALPLAEDSGGTWTFYFYETTDTAAMVDNTWNVVNVGLAAVPTAPAATNLGTLVYDTPATGSGSAPAGGTTWFKFTIPAVDRAANQALEIDTNGSVATDTDLCLFTATGARTLADFGDGAGLMAQIAYGADNRLDSGGGDAVCFNGRDGATLAAGEYYLAVNTGSTAVYQPAGWDAGPGNANSDSVTVNVRLISNSLPTPPNALDHGTIAGSDTDPNTSDVIVKNQPGQTGYISWSKFTTLQEVSDASGFFLDIDTEGTGVDESVAGTFSDTEIGVYDSTGAMKANDDDESSFFHSSLTFGQTAPARPAQGPVGNAGLAPNGRDGVLAAGTYYLAVGNFDVTYGAANFTVTSANVTAGTGVYTVNFRTNLPSAVPPVCSPADVGVQGGIPGHDNTLNNNDFIVFIDLFVAQDAAADIGIQGGDHGSDGQWNNNDFISFIDYFFDDQAVCTGQP